MGNEKEVNPDGRGVGRELIGIREREVRIYYVRKNCIEKRKKVDKSFQKQSFRI